MTIYVNGKFLGQQKTGTQVFALSMLKAMRLKNIHFQILAPKKAVIPEEYSGKNIGLLTNLNLWEQICLPLFILGKKNALLINFCNAAPLVLSNQLVTIHDLAFEQKGVQWFSASFKIWYRFLIPRICRKALAVLTVSQFSKTELMKHYHLPEEKIKLLSNVFNKIESIAERQIPHDYLFIPGADNPRKNASFVLENREVLKSRGLKLVLLSSGSDVFQKKEQLNDPDIIYLNYVTNDVYYSLIKYAKAVVYVSKYEGFGIPVLESLCLKTPVICSDLTVFKESFGTLPHYLSKTNSLITILEELPNKSISDQESQTLIERYSLANDGEQISVTLEPFLN